MVVVTEKWIRAKAGLEPSQLPNVRSLHLPGTHTEKISHLGAALQNFLRLKNLDLSRNVCDCRNTAFRSYILSIATCLFMAWVSHVVSCGTACCMPEEMLVHEYNMTVLMTVSTQCVFAIPLLSREVSLSFDCTRHRRHSRGWWDWNTCRCSSG